MRRLLELGSTHLSGLDSSPVVDIYRLVNTIENPLALLDVQPNQRQEMAANKLSTIARLQRRAIVGNFRSGLSGIDYADEIIELRGILLASTLDLGEIPDYRDLEGLKRYIKKAKKIKKGIVKKIVKVVKSPAFLSVAGLAANLIPGVGQVASAALLSAAAVRQQKEAGKEMKAEERAAQAAQDKQTDAELASFYAEYKTDYFIPLGYTEAVWASFSRDQKVIIAQTLAEGKLGPYTGKGDPAPATSTATSSAPTATKEEVVQTVATSQAMQQVYGDKLPGSGLTDVPPDIQREADQVAPQIANQIKLIGPDNFLEAGYKLVGQAGAVNNLYAGAGAESDSPLSSVMKAISGSNLDAIKKAVGLGEEDLKNSAFADGDPEAVEKALANAPHPSSIPWIPVVSITAAAATAVGLAFALRRR